ncbi:MAG: molybdopterin-synthase adenylyltransferase MoeB [Verrucomicrobia bacterium]|nr:molybdopterin-synthase adenylyltransferase MoeB [Verrucomicrobiota bacterium]
MDLSKDEIARYSRQVILPQVGRAGQLRLKAAKVLCVGAGGLGSPAAMYLAAAGVGRIGIADADRVDLSNLQRQLLHGTPELGQLKTESACARLRAINPHVEVVLHPVRLTAANAAEIIEPYDIVLDGTDNLPTRFLVNDACVLLGKPNIYGAVFQFEGQASVFAPKLGGPCYRCLFPEPPQPGAAPNCAEAGVLGVVAGLVGCIQANEVLKLVLRTGRSLMGRLLLIDALEGQFRELRVRRDPACPVCGERPSIKTVQDLPSACAATSSVFPDGDELEVSVQQLAQALRDPNSAVVVLDVREPAEAEIAHIRGARLMPLSRIAAWAGSLAPEKTYFLHCKSGRRSLEAAEFLRQRGFRHVKSVRGGILAWAEEIDHSMPKY